jgi:outer membrane protein assembly factor BamE
MFSNLLLRRTAVLLAALMFMPALPGCVYRMNIQQGNYLEKTTLDQLQVGMTRSQVRYLLGTPMVPDAFDNDRWDYLYYLRKGRLKKPEQRNVTVFFQDDKVAKVDRHDGSAASVDTVTDEKNEDAKKKTS